MENILIDGVFLNSGKDDASVVDFPYMQEGDYVKNMKIRNAYLENVKRMAIVHKNCEKFDLTTENINLEGSFDKIETTDQAIKIKRAERNLPPFKSTTKRDDI
jgi:hypothetical protein